MQQDILVFDFGGVIFNTSYKKFYAAYFAEQGLPQDKLDYFLTTVLPKEGRSASNIGKLDSWLQERAALFPEWRSAIEAVGAEAGFSQTIIGTIEGMPELLSSLKQQGYQLVGLTNWHSDSFATLAQHYPDIIKLFAQIVVSGEVGLRKPDAAIFSLAQQIYGNPNPQRIHYFDDKAANITAAQQSVGWQGTQFVDTNSVIKALSLPQRATPKLAVSSDKLKL